jgi:hypothetical protein
MVPRRLRREHHGHVDAAGELGQPFSVTWVGKTCEVKGMLVSRGGHDGVHFAVQSQLRGGFDGVSRDAAGPDDPVAIGSGVAAAQTPGADRDLSLRVDRSDLVFRSNDGDLGCQRLSQCTSRDLRTDAAWVAERDC